MNRAIQELYLENRQKYGLSAKSALRCAKDEIAQEQVDLDVDWESDNRATFAYGKFNCAIEVKLDEYLSPLDLGHDGEFSRQRSKYAIRNWSDYTSEDPWYSYSQARGEALRQDYWRRGFSKNQSHNLVFEDLKRDLVYLHRVIKNGYFTLTVTVSIADVELGRFCLGGCDFLDDSDVIDTVLRGGCLEEAIAEAEQNLTALKAV